MSPGPAPRRNSKPCPRYGFDRAEAAFALDIVKNCGRRAAAERLAITDGAARSHLSKIFDETGVSR
ncbi:hypothetical protein JJE66_18150 [Bradyrhizobium diazoefficiens]|uniref:hypothetical protein n=1 Tax=Bradyrhizobium diazoefficiens TaxID=1355477 RepID=UPI00190D1B74|nr:hypothetical protein [Bradyrhizobium diazoefficiens]MBK3663135.1 hypothetical protein [Bradyrhizobium diazoefficiens]